MDFILLIQQFFDWRALVDILLMSASLFFLYRTLQRLGTWGIAAGILIAIVVYLLASILDLKGIEWVMGNLSQVAVISLIIIFQPELRKIFERAASVRRSKRIDSGDAFTELLVDALWDLAGKRQGAIVVLPGKEPIQEWISGGYVLDALPSAPLIMSIFDPSSAGHDGAVIVSGGRLARFGVRLPVSNSSRLSEAYGTRHHAGMGLAEQSDALVMVVSEERGQISVFKEGKMHPTENRDELIASITEHWRKTDSYSLDLPQGKVGWRTVAQMSTSLFLATFFWSTLIISQGEMLEKVVTVPVEFTASPANLVLVGDKEKNVQLHLSGPKSELDAINPSELNVKIDLSKAVSGKQAFVITTDSVRLPRKISLLDVIPSEVELTLAEIVEQEVFIKPQLLGKLPGNRKIHSLDVIPPRVKVFSPASANTDRIVSLLTTPIYLDSIYSDTHVFCKIIAPPAIQPTEKNWPDVEVVIKVSQP